MASNLLGMEFNLLAMAMASNPLPSDGLQPKSGGLRPNSHGSNLLVMASNQIVAYIYILYNLIAMVCNLLQ